MRTFVISLPEAKERQAYMTEMLSGYGIDFEFFEAVDGRHMKPQDYPHYDRAKRRLFFGRDMTGGEMGVLLSHRAIYQKILKENIPLSLILEDDALLLEDFPHVLKTLKNGPKDFEAVRFLGSEKVAKHTQYGTRKVWKHYTLNRICATPGGAHAYLITPDGARKLLMNMDKNYMPIDTLLGYGWKTKLNAFLVQPLANQNAEQPQYIGEARFDKTIKISGWMKLAYPFTRAWHKLTEGLNKRLFYYKKYTQDKRIKS